jgi:hypothetical protein
MNDVIPAADRNLRAGTPGAPLHLAATSHRPTMPASLDHDDVPHDATSSPS